MFQGLENLITIFVEGVLKTPVESPLGSSLHFFFYDTIKILILLSLMTFAISYLRSWFQPQKTKEMLTHVKGVNANIAASLLGIVTPFCSCSSVPIFIGFVEAGIPLGITFSFLITSPIVNEAAFAILLASFGWKIALPLVAGYFSRKWIIGHKGEEWFKQKFLHVLTPVSISALLLTLVLLFSFKGEIILPQP